MNVRRADTIEKVVKRLKKYLNDRSDITWARFWVDKLKENTSLLKLVVMPTDPWWSGLEQQKMAQDLDNLVGRLIILEDERALHPRGFRKLYDEWELLVDRDIVNRIEKEIASSSSWFSIEEVGERSSGGLLRHYHALAFEMDCQRNFERMIAFANEFIFLGFEWFDKDDWGSISNAAQEAGRHVVLLCCDLRAIHGIGLPRSRSDALSYLVENDPLDPDCALHLQ